MIAFALDVSHISFKGVRGSQFQFFKILYCPHREVRAVDGLETFTQETDVSVPLEPSSLLL